jgi:hypothetical protein
MYEVINYTYTYSNMPVLTISESIYTRLQAIAIPLEDTPISVIERLLGEHESQKETHISSRDKASFICLNPHQHDALKHTRVTKAIINSVQVATPNWNKITNLAHEIAVEIHGLSPQLLYGTSLSNTDRRNISERGFKYLEKAGISVQQTEANLAWRNAFHLFKKLDIPVDVHFEWHDKKEAAYPGKKGRLTWGNN